MSLPSERHEPSPITGKSPRPAEAPAGASDPDADLELPDSVFRRRTTAMPPSTEPEREMGVPDPTDLNPNPGPPPTAAPRNKKKNPLEKKNGVNLGDSKFTRFMTRPETAMAARAAVDTSKSESPVPMEKVGRDNLHFGKSLRTSSAAPTYRPNKLFRVLDGIYEHSPLRWIDFVDRSGPRIIVGFILLGGLIGGMAWIYFRSLATDAGTAGTGDEIRRMAPEQRVERAKTALQELVQKYSAAQNIDARLPFVTSPDAVRAKMEDYYGTQQGTDPRMVSWSVGSPLPGPQGDWLPLTLQDSTGVTTVLPLEETDTGVRIDWESYTAYGEYAWADYCRRRPLPPAAMRVRFRKSEKYEGIYTKEKHQAYDLEHRSGAPRLTGYVRLTERAAQTVAHFCPDTQWKFATLYLRFESGTGGDHLINIDDIITTRWQDQAASWTRSE